MVDAVCEVTRNGHRAEIGYLGLVAAYLGAGLAVAHARGLEDAMSVSLYSEHLFVTSAGFIAIVLLCRCAYLTFVVRPPDLGRAIMREMRGRWLGRRRLRSALPVLGTMPVLLSVYSSFKQMIPLLQPFSWDAGFAELDRLLHGGVDPWRLLHPLLGNVPGTVAVNLVYNLWFLVTFGVLLWQVFTLARPRLRHQFLLSFALSWILLGTLAAVLLSSAGPCYFDRVAGLGNPGPFAPLMGFLQETSRTAPVWALTAQEWLWTEHVAGGYAAGAGISAMPSMHLSMVTLCVLLARRTGRVALVSMSVYAALILAGSVHLGWHYAIDGYAAILGTIAIWVGCGLLLRRRRPLSARPRPASDRPEP